MTHVRGGMASPTISGRPASALWQRIHTAISRKSVEQRTLLGVDAENAGEYGNSGPDDDVCFAEDPVSAVHGYSGSSQNKTLVHDVKPAHVG